LRLGRCNGCIYGGRILEKRENMAARVAAGRFIDDGIDETRRGPQGSGKERAAEDTRRRPYRIAGQFAVDRGNNRNVLKRIENVEKVLEAELRSGVRLSLRPHIGADGSGAF